MRHNPCNKKCEFFKAAAHIQQACMGKEKLSSLALMHIHHQVKIDLDEVVNLFATKHPRRLELGTILRD